MKTLKFLFALLVMVFTMQCTTARPPEPQQTQFEKKMNPEEIISSILGMSDADAAIFVQSLYSTENGKLALSKIKGLPVTPVAFPPAILTLPDDYKNIRAGLYRVPLDTTFEIFLPFLEKDNLNYLESQTEVQWVKMHQYLLDQDTFDSYTKSGTVYQNPNGIEIVSGLGGGIFFNDTGVRVSLNANSSEITLPSGDPQEIVYLLEIKTRLNLGLAGYEDLATHHQLIYF